MKIVYIAPQPIPSQSANSIHVMKMVQALGQLSHEVTLFFQKSGGATSDIYKIYGVEPVFTLSRSLPGSIPYALYNTVRAWLLKPDLVFSRSLLSAWLCAKIGLKVLFEIHDSPDSLSSFAQRFFKSLTEQNNVNFVVISRALTNHIIEQHGISEGKIILASDAADPLFESAQKPPFVKAPGSFHAGYTGHLYRGRGIEIIGDMAFSLPDVTFHIVGGKVEDIDYWRQKLSGLSNIIFYGHVPHAQVGDYLRHFDALLAPYQQHVTVGGNQGNTGRWMSPLKIFEYMAAGKPMICSDLPVLREVLENGTALLCPSDQPQKWVEALSFFRQDPGGAEKMGRTALKNFMENYTWRKRAEKIISFVKTHA